MRPRLPSARRRLRMAAARIRRRRSPARCPTPRPTTPASTTAGASSSRWRRSAGSSSGRRGPSSTTCGRTRRSSTTSTDQHPRVAATLAAHLEATNRANAGDEPTPGKIDPEALERLQALGYVGGNDATATSAARRKGPRPDPKDQLPLLHELLQAQALRDAGRLDDAAPPARGAGAQGPREPRRPPHPLVGLLPAERTLRPRSRRRDARSSSIPSPPSPCSTSPSPTRPRAVPTRPPPGSSACWSSTPRTSRPSSTSARSTTRAASASRPSSSTSVRRPSSPRLALVQVNRGSLALELNRLDVAEEALREAVALGGEPARACTSTWASSPSSEARRRSRAREYRAEVAAHPESFKAWVNLGLLERQAGRVDAALAAFERAAGRQGRRDRRSLPDGGDARRSRTPRGRRTLGPEALRRRPNDPRAQQLVDRLTRR